MKTGRSGGKKGGGMGPRRPVVIESHHPTQYTHRERDFYDLSIRMRRGFYSAVLTCYRILTAFEICKDVARPWFFQCLRYDAVPPIWIIPYIWRVEDLMDRKHRLTTLHLYHKCYPNVIGNASRTGTA